MVLLLDGSAGFGQSVAFESTLKKAKAGDAEAQHQVGNDLNEGTQGQADPVEAAKWFKKAADQGHVCASYDLGMCYATGSGLPANPALAVEWFRKAAEKGHPRALTNLGIAYHEGMGVPKDLAKATECFRKAAQAGESTAMVNLGVAYAQGEGLAKDRAEGLKWFQRAEEAGEPKAKEWIAHLRKEGLGFPGEENASGIIHGPNHAYMIQAPKGWVLDNAIWADRGIFAVFYEANKTLDDSGIVAYTMVQQKTDGGIEAHIKADMVHSLKGSTTAKVERKAALKTTLDPAEEA